jgi:arylsulfatase A
MKLSRFVKEIKNMNSVKRRLFPLVVAIAAILCRANCTAAPEPAEPKPNFIIIFTDDQGYQDLGVFGSPNIQTPHIDQMAKEGRIFTSFYVSSPLCSASRAALLTGSYPKRLGMERAVFFPQDHTGIHPDEVTIADMLKPAGYATACIGKWHLGHRKPFLPTSQGFDSYFGIPYSNDMTHPDNRQRPHYGKWDVYWKDQAVSVKQWHTPLMENEEVVELPVDQRTITRRYTDRAIDFVSSNRDKPFFLYLAHSMPHVPLYVPDDVYADTNKAYEVTIEHIDAETGRLLDTVRDLGLDKNTYIIFTSDNGPWLKFKHHAGSAKPLSGGKGWFMEGGIRVPCVMWAPGRIPAGTRTDEMASTLDLLPTFARLAGIEPKTRGPIDGLDISGLITGKDPSPRTELLYYSDKILFGMRKGDWKILGRDLNKNPALYNVADDLSERHNLAKKHPEKLAELKARAQELDAQITKEKRTLGVHTPE